VTVSETDRQIQQVTGRTSSPCRKPLRPPWFGALKGCHSVGRRPISQRPGRAAHPAPRQWDEIVKAAQSLLHENTDRVDGIKEASVASWPRSCRRAT